MPLCASCLDRGLVAQLVARLVRRETGVHLPATHYKCSLSLSSWLSLTHYLVSTQPWLSVENAQLLTNNFIQVLLVLFIISIIIYQLALRRSNAMQRAMIIASFYQLIAIHLKQNQLTSATDFFPREIHCVVDMLDHSYYLKSLPNQRAPLS